MSGKRQAGHILYDKAILHIDLDAFFASVEQLLNPALRGQPVIVAGPGEHRTVVAAASYEARPYGIKAGMPATQARRLCPHGRFVRGHPGTYADFSEKVFDICRQFTPLLEPASIDEGYLDMTGTDRHYRKHISCNDETYWPVTAAERLKTTIKNRLGLNCSIGIGVNKLIAKVVSKIAKPNGIAAVLPGYERTFLASLPIEALPGIGRRSRDLLEPLAVRTIGDMQRLSVNLLKGIFGVVGEDFYMLAIGLGSDRIEPPAEPKSVSRGTTLDEDSWDLNFVKQVTRELVEDLGRQLRRLGYYCKLITVHIRYGDFVTVSHCGPLRNFTNHDHEIYLHTCQLIDKLYDHRRSIRHVSVKASVLANRSARQMELWQLDNFEKYKRIYHTVDNIRARYGSNAILFGKIPGQPANTVGPSALRCGRT